MVRERAKNAVWHEGFKVWPRGGGLGGSREDLAEFCMTLMNHSQRTADVFPVVASLPPTSEGEKRRPEMLLLFAGLKIAWISTGKKFRCLCWRLSGLYKSRGRIETSEPGINSCFSCSTSCLARFTSLAPLESRLVIGQLYALCVFWLVIDAFVLAAA